MKAGFDLSGYSNAMASIHTILRRLEEGGEVEKKEEGLKTVFRWKPKMVCAGASVQYIPKNEAVIDKAAGIGQGARGAFLKHRRRKHRHNHLLQMKSKGDK